MRGSFAIWMIIRAADTVQKHDEPAKLNYEIAINSNIGEIDSKSASNNGYDGDADGSNIYKNDHATDDEGYFASDYDHEGYYDGDNEGGRKGSGKMI